MIILTIVDYLNYGNRLQNYAMTRILSNYSKNVVTISDQFLWKQSSYRELFFQIAKRIYHYIFPYYRCIRFCKGVLFTRKHLHLLPYSLFNLQKLFQKDLSIIVGSDQVWNPYFSHLSERDTLSFLKDGTGVSYAASFGVDELPEEYSPQLSEIAKNFKAVSVREESAKKILEPYMKDVHVHVDPTLLLTPEEWETVMHKPSTFTKKKYVALYFLGQVNETWRTQINEFAESHGYEIIELMDRSSVYYTYGPAEFLWVMQHAEAVFTDSFHGCVFSFLFDKPFVVYDREDHNHNMSSRMETLLPLFHLEDRAYTGSLPEDLLEHDYSSGYAVLEKERERSFDYLKRNLK